MSKIEFYVYWYVYTYTDTHIQSEQTVLELIWTWIVMHYFNRERCEDDFKEKGGSFHGEKKEVYIYKNALAAHRNHK